MVEVINGMIAVSKFLIVSLVIRMEIGQMVLQVNLRIMVIQISMLFMLTIGFSMLIHLKKEVKRIGLRLGILQLHQANGFEL